jgi:hypothetical protein
LLKVKTYLDRSPLHGIGLFAGEKIKADQEVWAFHALVDLALEPCQWQAMEAELAGHSFNQVRQLAYKEDGRFHICIDNAQFMNHCARTFNVGNRKEGNTMVALRDIEEGEELVCNYFEFCDQDDWSMQWLTSFEPPPA